VKPVAGTNACTTYYEIIIIIIAGNYSQVRRCLLTGEAEITDVTGIACDEAAGTGVRTTKHKQAFSRCN